ncbi:hypothetical protein J41TS8_33020 [Bacillus sp. J41TS8]|nr:hypothetical protein J41TS8_33020 [Bacillus sp. J41TS8]
MNEAKKKANVDIFRLVFSIHSHYRQHFHKTNRCGQYFFNSLYSVWISSSQPLQPLAYSDIIFVF